MSDEPTVRLSGRCPQCGAALVDTSCPRCALALAGQETELDDDEICLLFPELDIVGKIGRGGFGTVYRAEHRKLKRPVALKFLDPQIAESASGVERFEQEMAAVGKLDHPGIVRAHDAGEREGHWYIVMEFVEGEDLAKMSRRAGRMEPKLACYIVRQAALALGYAHAQGLVHRDVKPSNLMVATGADGGKMVALSPVKVLDFGLAATTDKVGEGFQGTPDYAAPEQITAPAEVDTRADIYGLGATLFRLLTGVPPRRVGGELSISSRIQRIGGTAAPPIASLRDDLPAGLAQLCDRMLAMDREQRPATAQEVADLLAPFAGIPKARRRWLWPAAAALMLTGALAGWFFSRPKPAKLLPDQQSALVKRDFKDIGKGLYFFNGTPIGIPGTITGWTFYDDKGGPNSVTPMLFDRVDDKTFTLLGLGTSRRSDGSGVQTFSFDLLAGTDKVGPNTCFGFCDRLVTTTLDAGTVETVSTNPGVVDGENEGPWLFTHGGRIQIPLPLRLGLQFAVIEGGYGRTDRPVPVNVGRTYSARAIIVAPGAVNPVPPTPRLTMPGTDAMDDDLPPLRDKLPPPYAATPPPTPGSVVIDDDFDDGVVGTNTYGKGDGFDDTGYVPLSEDGGFLLLDAGKLNDPMSFRCDQNNGVNPFQQAATRLSFTFGKITSTSRRHRLWIGYRRHALRSVLFFPGSLDPSKNPPGKGLYLSIFAQNRREDGFANRGNLVATDALNHRTILASWKWADPDKLSGLVVRLTTTDKTYQLEFSGAAGGVPLFVKGGPTGAITGMGDPEPGLTYDFGGMNQYMDGMYGGVTLDRVTLEANVPQS